MNALWRYLGEPDVARRPRLHRRRSPGIPGLGRRLRPGRRRDTSAVPRPSTRGSAASWLHRIRPFEDVGPNHVARKAADWARAHVIVAPLADHTFRPNDVLTRAPASGWVWRFLDRPPSGPVDPTPGGDDVDRATAVTWLWEAAGSPVVTLPSDYTDVAGAPPRDGGRLGPGLRPLPRHTRHRPSAPTSRCCGPSSCGPSTGWRNGPPPGARPSPLPAPSSSEEPGQVGREPPSRLMVWAVIQAASSEAR